LSLLLLLRYLPSRENIFSLEGQYEWLFAPQFAANVAAAAEQATAAVASKAVVAAAAVKKAL
jgi:hypothetical protein